MKTLIAALCAFFAVLGNVAAGDLSTAFHIMWKGRPIGFHVVNVEKTHDGVRVDTRVEMRVKFGPIPLYRYSHRASEVWRNGTLYSLRSTTDDDGDEMSLQIWRQNGVLMGDGDAYSGPAPKGAVPSSWWNRELLGAKTILNTQNGEIIPVAIVDLGRTTLPGGGSADHFRVTGSLALDLWFDGARWIGSHVVIDGEELTYQPIEDGAERRRLLAMRN